MEKKIMELLEKIINEIKEIKDEVKNNGEMLKTTQTAVLENTKLITDASEKLDDMETHVDLLTTKALRNSRKIKKLDNELHKSQ